MQTILRGLCLAAIIAAATPSAVAQQNAQPVSVEGMLQDQVGKCWMPPAVKGNAAEGGIARIRVSLLPDGRIDGQPLIIDKPAGPLGLVFAESAARAVTRCAPFKLPPEMYENWKSIMLHFDTITF